MMSTEPIAIEPIAIESGTLVWVGNHSHPEFIDAFQFCRNHAAQIATRATPRQLLERPAGFVKRILVARLDRRPVSSSVFAALAQRYRSAEWLALTSSLCDGESRTGAPWPSIAHLRFSRWRERIPGWLDACGYQQPRIKQDGSVIVLCDRYETAEPYLDLAAAEGHTALWSRHFNSRVTRNLRRVIWDDSVAAPTTAIGWKQRIGDASPLQHTWLVTQPRSHDIQAAISGGVTQVLTKPVLIDALF
jgi:hypothetical protein